MMLILRKAEAVKYSVRDDLIFCWWTILNYSVKTVYIVSKEVRMEFRIRKCTILIRKKRQDVVSTCDTIMRRWSKEGYASVLSCNLSRASFIFYGTKSRPIFGKRRYIFFLLAHSYQSMKIHFLFLTFSCYEFSLTEIDQCLKSSFN